MRELIEFATFSLSGLLVFMVCIIAPLGFAVVQYGKWQCSGYAESTGKPTKYGNAMCFIQDSGQWYSWEEYKHRLVARGEMKK